MYKIQILDDADQKSQELVQKHGLYDHKLDLANFQMPTIDLLRDYGNEEISINKDELEENKNKIVGLLKNFNVGIAEIKATNGPVSYTHLDVYKRQISSLMRLKWSRSMIAIANASPRACARAISLGKR